jgi:hypothetical protein
MSGTTYTATAVIGGGYVTFGGINSTVPSGGGVALPIVYNATGYDSAGQRVLPPMNGAIISGSVLHRIYPAQKVRGGGINSPSYAFILGVVMSGIALGGNYVRCDGGIIGASAQDCAIWTSRIGSMDFNEEVSGEVKKFFLSWPGWVYQILMLSDSGPAIAYGQNGVTLLKSAGPAGLDWSKQDIYPIGIKGRNSAIATKRGHYFIDRNGFLGHVAPNGAIDAIDYSNYFSAMSASLVMSYDAGLDLVYICDGTYGYVLTAWGLGKGPVNVTGMGNQSGTLYAVASSALVFSPLQITLDVEDMEDRGEKTITELDVGINTTKSLYGSIYYRWNKAVVTFFQTPWVLADQQGRIFVTASGVEFKIALKLSAYEAIRPDYIKVIGIGDVSSDSDNLLKQLRAA